MRIIVALVLVLSFTDGAWSQSDTSYKHNRNKAALFSAVIPGMGQIYNEIGHRKVQGRKHISWWRAPIYIGGIAFTSYLAYQNAYSAKQYKREWLYRNEFGASTFLFDKFKDLTEGEVIINFEQHAKYRDYAVAGIALVYALNIIDAFVDAHFVTFDVSDDLTFNIKPAYFGKTELGCRLTLQFN